MKGTICVFLLSVAFALAADINSQCPTDYTIELLLPHKECNKYYQCLHGQALELQCGKNLFYNTQTQQCDYEENVDCSDRIETEPELSSEEVNKLPICECPSDFSKELLFPHDDCTKFYKCYQGKPKVFDCQPGLVYNSEMEWCDWPQNIDCNNRQFTCPDPNELLENDTEKEIEANADCPTDWTEEKLLPHSDCNKFYKCYLGNAVRHDCPLGLNYKIETERCDWPENVDCTGRN